MYTYTYEHIYIYVLEIGGKEAPATPNREIGFSFVSCSCRACVRAKLCGCVRQVFPTLGARMQRLTPPARGLAFHFLMLYAWVLKEIH